MKTKIGWKENVLTIIITLILVVIVNLRVLLSDEKTNWVITLVTIFIGLSIGRQIVRPEKVQEDINKYLKNPAILIYCLFYVILSSFIDWSLLPQNYTFFSIKIIFGVFFFYEGLKSIQTKKAWRWGGQLTKNQSVVSGVIAIIFSLLVLFERFIIGMFYP